MTGPATQDDVDPATRSRVRLNALLYLLALVAAAACVVSAVTLVREVREEPVPALPRAGSVTPVALEQAPEEDQERLAAVLESAEQQATAFVNIRYDDVDASLEEVKAGATGAFLEQYEKSTDGLVDVLRQNRSVMTGEVVWTGVVAADDDSATVVVATTGTVANKQTKGKSVARYFRLQLELVEQDGRWLTRDLQFVA